MTVYIICTVLLGGIALHQYLIARAWRDAAQTYRDAALKSVEDHKCTAACLKLSTDRIELIRLALPKHLEASARGDAKACNRIIYEAIRAGNEPKVTEEL